MQSRKYEESLKDKLKHMGEEVQRVHRELLAKDKEVAELTRILQ